MAKVTFGSGVTEIRGSVGGTVFSRNSGGAYIRARTTPIQPGSTLQETAKSIFAAGVNIYTNTLTAYQRAQWDAYAAAVSYTDVFGATRYMSGQNRFVQAYSCGVSAGVTETNIYTAPTTYTEAEPVTASDVTVNQGATTADDTFTIPAVTAPAEVEAGDLLLFYMGNKITAATNYYKGPFRYAGQSVYASGTAFPEVTLTDPWGQECAEGDTRSLKVKIFKIDNRISPEVRQILTLGAYVTP